MPQQTNFSKESISKTSIQIIVFFHLAPWELETICKAFSLACKIPHPSCGQFLNSCVFFQIFHSREIIANCCWQRPCKGLSRHIYFYIHTDSPHLMTRIIGTGNWATKSLNELSCDYKGFTSSFQLQSLSKVSCDLQFHHWLLHWLCFSKLLVCK